MLKVHWNDGNVGEDIWWECYLKKSGIYGYNHFQKISNDESGKHFKNYIQRYDKNFILSF